MLKEYFTSYSILYIQILAYLDFIYFLLFMYCINEMLLLDEY